jgi:uncharacterized protein YndB with AHSA1/START domain
MMPIKKDASGRRFVEAAIEVPGTPEEVWQAIASGPGISSWFVPATIDERVGGKATANFGPGMESVGTITAWDPPRRYAFGTTDDSAPNSPAVATEWTVESRTGGACVVRVVHSWFARTDEWDNQFEGHEHGWAAFFRILRLYLTHFRGHTCSAFQLIGHAPGPASKAWDALTGPLDLADAVKGQQIKSPAGAPRLAGVVEHVGPAEYPELLVRLDEPAPGIVHSFAMPMGGRVLLPVRVYLYGDRGRAVAATSEDVWGAWMNEHFPAADDRSVVSRES